MMGANTRPLAAAASVAKEEARHVAAAEEAARQQRLQQQRAQEEQLAQEERERQAQEKRRQRALQGKLQLRLRFPPTRGGGDGSGVSNNVAPLIKAVTVARCVAA